MDPNANLEEQERILTQWKDKDPRLVKLAERRLKELRDALGYWLDYGGFAPDWTKAPQAAKYYGHFV